MGGPGECCLGRRKSITAGRLRQPARERRAMVRRRSEVHSSRRRAEKGRENGLLQSIVAGRIGGPAGAWREREWFGLPPLADPEPHRLPALVEPDPSMHLAGPEVAWFEL